jgi:hypothetical protein
MFLEAVCIAAEVMGNALLDKYVLNQILIQTIIGDQAITIDNPDYYFKIVR